MNLEPEKDYLVDWPDNFYELTNYWYEQLGLYESYWKNEEIRDLYLPKIKVDSGAPFDYDPDLYDTKARKFLEDESNYVKEMNYLFHHLYQISGTDDSHFWIQGSRKGLELNYDSLLQNFLLNNPDKAEEHFICHIMDEISEDLKYWSRILSDLIMDDQFEIYVDACGSKVSYLSSRLASIGFLLSKKYEVNFNVDSADEEFLYKSYIPVKSPFSNSIDKTRFKEIKDYHFTAFQAAYFLVKIGLVNKMIQANVKRTDIYRALAGLTSNHQKTIEPFIRDLNGNNSNKISKYKETYKDEIEEMDKILSYFINME